MADELVKDVGHTGMVFLAAGSFEVDDFLQARVDQFSECFAVLIEATEELVFGEHRKVELCFLFAGDPLEPDPLADDHVPEELARPGLRVRLRMDKLDPLAVGPCRLVDQAMKFPGQRGLPPRGGISRTGSVHAVFSSPISFKPRPTPN